MDQIAPLPSFPLIDTNMNVREKKEEEMTYVAFVICMSQRKKRKETNTK
jgi:hypothetical protein